jgi:16S rRNA (guanine527-N7)-methyltransferase
VGLAAGALGIVLPEGFERHAAVYLEELRRWDRVARLTGYDTEAEQIAHLIIDSLRLLSILPAAASPLLDLGSGAGVPGLVLKLARPDWAVTLVEANRRRANFLRHVVRHLGLERVVVAHTRAEALAAEAEFRAAFRTVTARAVGPPSMVWTLAAPLLAAEGQLVVSLGPAARAAGAGRLRVVRALPDAGLPEARRFLIMPATARAVGGEATDVPRGTSGPGHRGSRGSLRMGARRPVTRPGPAGAARDAASQGRSGGASAGGRESEGRRGQDDHGGQPGGGPRGR